MDNPTMMEIYPFGGVLAYMKYHYLDGIVKQNLLLMDKTRYHYGDKERVAVAKNVKSADEVKSMLSIFGVGQEAEAIAEVRNEIGE